MPATTWSRYLLLAMFLAGFMVASSMTIVNLRLGPRISYYESPIGIIERSRNYSAEQEYISLKRSSFIATIAGLLGLVVMMGCFGMIFSESRRKEKGSLEEYSI